MKKKKKCDKDFHQIDLAKFQDYFPETFGCKTMDELNKRWPFEKNPWAVSADIVKEQVMWMGKCPGDKVCPVRHLEGSLDRWRKITMEQDRINSRIFWYKGKVRGKDIILNTDENHTYARYCDDCQFYKSNSKTEKCTLFNKELDRYDGPLQLHECYEECELVESDIKFHYLEKEYKEKTTEYESKIAKLEKEIAKLKKKLK